MYLYNHDWYCELYLNYTSPWPLKEYACKFNTMIEKINSFKTNFTLEKAKLEIYISIIYKCTFILVSKINSNWASKLPLPLQALGLWTTKSQIYDALILLYLLRDDVVCSRLWWFHQRYWCFSSVIWTTRLNNVLNTAFTFSYVFVE